MAMQSLSLRRRALTSLSSTLLHRSLSTPTLTPSPPNTTTNAIISQLQTTVRSPQHISFLLLQSRALFTGSRCLEKERQYKLYKEGDEITEDTILFEGCDYNHWLITMDFPKDPKPTPQEMVATYERTCAQGLNISIEEAKKKIYACSTTTYQGFQAVMTEEESKQFENIPGVVFVLPDSYIDPQNKEYGGDKYENGVITPRPPPVQYQRSRYRDRPRYDRQGGQMPNQQGSSQYGQQGPMHGDGRNFGPPQNYPPQQNYGPQGQGDRIRTNNRDYVPGGRGYGPPQSYASPQNYAPPGQVEQMPVSNRDYTPGTGGNYQANRGPVPPYQTNYNQGQWGNPPRQDQRGFPGDWGNSPPHAGTYGQNTGYGQNYPQEGQRSPPTEHRNMHGEQGNRAPAGQMGTDHGRY